MRDASPEEPEANFVRDVDFCSSTFLAVRVAAIDPLDTSNSEIAVGAYWDADLCASIAEARYRVVYDPSIVVYRSADVASGDPPAADFNDARAAFVRRHAAYLRGRRNGDAKAVVFARMARATLGAAEARDEEWRRVLFIDATVPSRGLDPHAVRSCDLIATMATMGFDVTVFPTEAVDCGMAAMLADMPETVEVMHDASIADLAGFLKQRAGYYDIAWVAGARDIAAVRAGLDASGEAPTQIVFEADATTEDGAGAPVFYVRTPSPTSRGFEDRLGLLFRDALHGAGTPAYDGLCWFVDAVLPLVQAALGWETQLTIVADTPAADEFDRFRHHARITLRAPPVDPMALYDAHRMFIAPAPTAAGAAYRLLELAAYGLPVVAGDALCERTGWRDGVELLAAPVTDPARLAARIVALYRDKALWQRLREAALARLVADHGRERYVEALRRRLG